MNLIDCSINSTKCSQVITKFLYLTFLYMKQKIGVYDLNIVRWTWTGTASLGECKSNVSFYFSLWSTNSVSIRKLLKLNCLLSLYYGTLMSAEAKPSLIFFFKTHSFHLKTNDPNFFFLFLYSMCIWLIVNL